MSHEITLQAALAGGPVPQEVREHLESCAACREELAELRSIERELVTATPAAPRVAAWEEGLVRGLAAHERPSLRWMPLAASLLLAAGLLAGWLAGHRSGAGASAAPLASSSIEEPARGLADLAVLAPVDEDSTAELLQMAEPLAQDIPQTPPAALENYLSPAGNGGWNG